jgi:hypothetical protein
MQLNLLIIISTILSVISIKQTTKPNLCINCRHFLSNTDDSKFGKCGLFPINKTGNYYLVNGINEEDMDYSYCETARSFSNLCGENGKLYKKKYVKKQKDNYIHNKCQW